MKRYILNILAKSRHQQGFTLIEMVVVIAIIVVLILLIVPNLIGQKQKAEKRTSAAFETTLQTQLELYKDDHPKTQVTNFEQLKGEYLTSDQINRAEKEFKITNQHVEKK